MMDIADMNKGSFFFGIRSRMWIVLDALDIDIELCMYVCIRYSTLIIQILIW